MSDKENDRPAVEVTSEMIEAGLRHLYKYDPEWGANETDTVTRIFLAMLRASAQNDTCHLGDQHNSSRFTCRTICSRLSTS